MDVQLERKIINAFFYKNKRDRIAFELTRNNGKEIIHKLGQYHSSYININNVLFPSNKLRSVSDIIKTMEENGVNTLCYSWSEYPDYHRKKVKLKEAIEAHLPDGFAALVVGLPSGFAYFRNDSFSSHRPNCFLKPPVRFDKLV